MLNNEPAKKIYDMIRNQPIHDFHCHLDPKEIYEDQPFDNIVDVWLGGDHYKWRLMRANGVAEKYITGDASNEEKFQAWAETVGVAVGNPLYHWSHLEMSQVFGIQEPLNGKNWKSHYQKMNQAIKEQKMSPRQLIDAAKVKFIGTTDHPLDTLEWHQKIAEDSDFDVTVAPTFRPDEAFVTHHNFRGFVEKLAETTGIEIKDFDSFVQAMEQRVVYFAEHGAKASDHSLGVISFQPASKSELNNIFDKAIEEKELTVEEEDKWQTEVFAELARLYKENNMVAQVHFGALRNNNTKIYEKVGPDSGIDSMGDQTALGKNLNALLDNLNKKDNLPKMIWYNLNPMYNKILVNTLGNFQGNEEGIKSKLQFGAAWWFSDTKLGMIDQMNNLADEGILANFVGMLTDSRSFLSYQRHDYFRRILASYLGEWVANEEIPNDDELLSTIAQNIVFDNAKNFFQ